MKTKAFFFFAVCGILVSCMQQEMDLVASIENRGVKELSEKPMQPGAYENYTQLMEVLCGQTRSNIDDPVYPDYYVSEDGDSGGIVYAYQSSNNTRYTVGINKGRISLREPNGEIGIYAICVKAYIINQRLGLTRY